MQIDTNKQTAFHQMKHQLHKPKLCHPITSFR